MKFKKTSSLTRLGVRLMRWLRLMDRQSFKQRKRAWVEEDLLRREIKRGKEASLFDPVWYAQQNSDLDDADPVVHYLLCGWKEGRQPSKRFNGNQYLKDYPDIAAAGTCPLVHFLRHGRYEGRDYEDLTGVRHLNDRVKSTRRKRVGFRERIREILDYPVRLQEECDRLKAEIKELKKRQF